MIYVHMYICITILSTKYILVNKLAYSYAQNIIEIREFLLLIVTDTLFVTGLVKISHILCNNQWI